MRAEQRDYWGAPGAKAADVEREDLSLVAVAPSVMHGLHRQFYSPARPRGGLLFGHRRGGALHVTFATTVGRTIWYPRSLQAVLDVDVRFTLGWSEAVRKVLGESTDWVGNWMMSENGHQHGDQKDRQWFAWGQRQGLFDESHILLIPGWKGEGFTGRAYRQNRMGEVEELLMNFEGEDISGKIQALLATAAANSGESLAEQ